MPVSGGNDALSATRTEGEPCASNVEQFARSSPCWRSALSLLAVLPEAPAGLPWSSTRRESSRWAALLRRAGTSTAYWPGDTEEELSQTEQILKDLRRQLTNVLADLAAQESASNGVIAVLTPEEVVAMLDEFGEMLAAAASAETDEEMRTARRIIDELTGGRIELFQRGERKAQRGWLKGRFSVDVVSGQ